MEVYLDNAATSYPKPDAVYDAVNRFMREIGASSGRGAYRKALEADRIVYETRESLGRLFNIRDVSRIVFTQNATESLNLAIRGLLRRGDHVVTSSIEHNAVWRPLKTLESELGIEITAVSCSPEGHLDPEDVEEAIRPNTKLIVLLHASNVIGTILPIGDVGRIAERYGIPFLVDSAQTAGVYPIDVEESHIDLLAFAGHKGLFGPPGTGGLYIREGIDLTPLKAGGTGSESALERQPDFLPDRYEAGTLNAPGIAGLGAGVDFILDVGVDKIREKERSLTERLLRGLEDIPEVEIYGPRDPEGQVGVMSINVSDYPPGEVGYVLDEAYGVMVRTGLHCSPCAHRTIGTIDRGTIRISPGYFNTEGDINYLLGALREIVERSSAQLGEG
ncbi:MAG: aminotransferase class V-fold PLP-dependent enzyme [bacterium]